MDYATVAMLDDEALAVTFAEHVEREREAKARAIEEFLHVPPRPRGPLVDWAARAARYVPTRGFGL